MARISCVRILVVLAVFQTSGFGVSMCSGADDATNGDGKLVAGTIRDDNQLKTKLVWCPPGTFRMGMPKDGAFGMKNDTPQK